MTDEELLTAMVRHLRREKAKGDAYAAYIAGDVYAPDAVDQEAGGGGVDFMGSGEHGRIDNDDPKEIIKDAAAHALEAWHFYHTDRNDNEPQPYVRGQGNGGHAHQRSMEAELDDTLEETEALLAELGMDELPDEISQEDYDKIPWRTALKGLFYEPYDSEGNQIAQGTRKLMDDGIKMRDALASTQGDTVGRRRKRIFGTNATSLDAPGETATGEQGTKNLATLILEKAFRRPLTDKEKSRIDRFNLFIHQVAGQIDSTNVDDHEPAVAVGRILADTHGEVTVDIYGEGAVLHIDEHMRREIKASGVRSIDMELTDEERTTISEALEVAGLGHWDAGRLIKEVHNQWAESAGDTQGRSLALQMAAAREAGVPEEEIAARVFHTTTRRSSVGPTWSWRRGWQMKCLSRWGERMEAPTLMILTRSGV